MPNIPAAKPTFNSLGPIPTFLLSELPVTGLAFAIWQAIQLRAVEAWYREVHQRAGAIGKAKMATARKRGENSAFDLDKTFTYLGDHELNLTKGVPKVGRVEAKRANKRLWKQGPDQPIKIEVTKYGLLIAASDGADNIRQIDTILDRLRQPLNVNRTTYPPLLLDVQPGKKLILTVNPVYLCGKKYPYSKVPLKFPIGRVHVFKAFAFFHWLTDIRKKGIRGYDIDAFYKKIGINSANGSLNGHCGATVNAVNFHLSKIGADYAFEVGDGSGRNDVFVTKRTHKPLPYLNGIGTGILNETPVAKRVSNTSNSRSKTGAKTETPVAILTHSRSKTVPTNTEKVTEASQNQAQLELEAKNTNKPNKPYKKTSETYQTTFGKDKKPSEGFKKQRRAADLINSLRREEDSLTLSEALAATVKGEGLAVDRGLVAPRRAAAQELPDPDNDAWFQQKLKELEHQHRQQLFDKAKIEGEYEGRQEAFIRNASRSQFGRAKALLDLLNGAYNDEDDED